MDEDIVLWGVGGGRGKKPEDMPLKGEGRIGGGRDEGEGG